MSPVAYIKSRQLFWAKRNGLTLNAKYTDYAETLEENLFEPLSSGARKEFDDADGNELKCKTNAPPKMQALFSSSALAVNVFHYWRNRNFEVIAKACGIPSKQIKDFRFEYVSCIADNINRKVFPRDPNIDVVFRYGGQIKEVGIESKFTEAFTEHKGIRRAYLELSSLWEDIPHCRKLAEENSKSNAHNGVDYAQLLKHVLGLKHRNGIGRFWLVYAWYAAPSPLLNIHKEQLDRFREVLKKDGIEFRSITYQAIIYRLANMIGEEDRHYLDYLTERYL